MAESGNRESRRLSLPRKRKRYLKFFHLIYEEKFGEKSIIKYDDLRKQVDRVHSRPGAFIDDPLSS